MMDTILVPCVLTEQRLRMTARKNMGMAGVKAPGGRTALLGIGLSENTGAYQSRRQSAGL
ncbi:hypothetical protein PISMIDRAFT_677319 [Pisolithus microcarpus 441]|uniref:Uncharacterized protein n=1 Tax=Pisolithus microcarpus 441 TaxID=765257 RepID=A0A0C9Z7J7_9AGAM|nr:hypothetical protein PISMIDRAFT_677319 [Pisolithus microcarpus 441]